MSADGIELGSIDRESIASSGKLDVSISDNRKQKNNRTRSKKVRNTKK